MSPLIAAEGLRKSRLLILFFHIGLATAQHGVIREYAALAPKPDAVALRPLFDQPLTDTSITLGPDKAYYLTGSAVSSDASAYAHNIGIWRSTNLRAWVRIRELILPAPVKAPEIHYLKDRFWLTLGMEGGGTELLRFNTADLATSAFDRRKITSRGEDPSLFLDDDGTFYWVMGAGEVARMKPDPLDGLASELKPMLEPLQGAVRSAHMHGAFLSKIDGFYHLFVAERRLSHEDLGRTGLPGGTDDTFVVISSHPDSGYGPNRYLAFPHAGQTTLFRDANSKLWATYSCTDARGVFRLRPGAFPVEHVPATQALWAIGFSSTALEQPVRYKPQGMLLRPDRSYVYESGSVGSLRPGVMDPVPGQSAAFPWIRDTSMMRGPDGNYYMTGTSGNMDAIHLWQSADMQHWRYLTAAFRLGTGPEIWYNQVPGKFLWAPEIHYFNNTYWIAWCVNQKLGIGLLKSTTGKPEGPYVPSHQGNGPLIRPNIDASLFQDDDGVAYLVWQNGMVRKMNRDLSAFEGETFNLRTVDGVQVGYEGVFLCKIGTWYVLSAAEWNGGGNREDGTYDMMYAVSRKLEGPYSKRRVAVPHAGHSTMFQDGAGRWYTAMFGNDRTAPFRALPGVVPLDVQETASDLIIRPR